MTTLIMVIEIQLRYFHYFIIRIANDKDLYNIIRQLLNPKIKGNEVYFQHAPSHKGSKGFHVNS